MYYIVEYLMEIVEIQFLTHNRVETSNNTKLFKNIQ